MQLSRLAALVAVPATLALAACGGGTSGVIGNGAGTAGQYANLRFVNGDPQIGNVDVYVQATGAAAPGATADGKPQQHAGYHETPNIKQYYESAKF